MSREYRAWFDTAMQQSLAPRQCLVYNISASGWAWCVNIYVLLSSHAANEKAMATQANSSKHLPECYSRWNTVLWLPPRCTPAPLKALWKIGKAKKVEGSTKPKPYYTMQPKDLSAVTHHENNDEKSNVNISHYDTLLSSTQHKCIIIFSIQPLLTSSFPSTLPQPNKEES